MSTEPNAVIKLGALLKECSRSKSGLAQRAVFDRPSQAHQRSAKEPAIRKRGGHKLGSLMLRQRSAERHGALA